MRYRFIKVLMVSLVFMFFSAFLTLSTSAITGNLVGEKICIDPGHGGSDPGAINEEYNLSESMINLDVSYALKSLLESSGAQVVLTRTDDSYKNNNDRYTFCNNEEATILVSVHTNSVVDPTWDGAMALYFRPDTDDQILAQSIYDVMYPQLKISAPDPDNFLPFGLDWFASGVLLKSDMPATMVEPLFMSNPAEAGLLVQLIYDDPLQGDINTGCENLNCRRGEIARSIHQGVLGYVEATATGRMHISAIDMSFDKKARQYFVYSRVAIQDEDGDYVPGADVSVSITKPDDTVISISGTSGIDGVATFKIRSDQIGTYKTIVTDVNKDGWIYHSAVNIETSDFVTIP